MRVSRGLGFGLILAARAPGAVYFEPAAIRPDNVATMALDGGPFAFQRR
jgi:hypothetical protein